MFHVFTKTLFFNFMNFLNRHLVLILALICMNQLVYAQVFYGEGFEPLEGVPSPDEFVPPIQNKQSINSQQDIQDAYVRKDYATVLRLLRLLADRGDASAQFNLGYMYYNGRGVHQDYKEAVRWYRLAAGRGHALAQFNLGVMYDNGRGVTQDNREAVKWYRLAAEQNDASAQTNLGWMYETGHGVTQDYQEALKSYRLAEAQAAQANFERQEEAKRVRVERANLNPKMAEIEERQERQEANEKQKKQKQEADEKQKKQKQEADEKQMRRDADARAVAAMGNEVAAYKAKIRAKILRNIVVSSDIPKDALAEFDVTLSPGGAVLNVKLVKSSGNAMYDRAVERAIKKSDPLPVPPEGPLSNQFRELHLNFSPNE